MLLPDQRMGSSRVYGEARAALHPKQCNQQDDAEPTISRHLLFGFRGRRAFRVGRKSPFGEDSEWQTVFPTVLAFTCAARKEARLYIRDRHSASC